MRMKVKSHLEPGGGSVYCRDRESESKGTWSGSEASECSHSLAHENPRF